jgi:subtilisin family serine protease
MIGLRRGHLFAAAATAAFFAATAPAWAGRVEVVVELKAPPLAQVASYSRVMTARARSTRLDLSSRSSVFYERLLARAQQALQRRITTAIPSARFRWHYRVVLDGVTVTVPAGSASRLARMPGVARVYPSITYRETRRSLNQTPTLIGAPTLWGPSLSTAGNGIKIGIVDDGLDQAHPFLSPVGYAMPAGFPKGNTAFTTAKVIVARSFVPATSTWKNASLPFDPLESEHATHVAGIAAGENGTTAAVPGRGNVCCLSGIAPRAYLGNYKVLNQPTDCCGLDGNSPEIAAGIEAAVRDGMDVINLSLGEPEIEPLHDLVVKAIDGAAAAGVVPAIAAGNDFLSFGFGSVGSPGTAPDAITAAAVSKDDVIADFSSAGPTPISLQLKPDVSAPGVSVLSSVPPQDGLWASFDGTSMASPHVAGAAALLRQRHPGWTVQQIKSALVLTGLPVYTGPDLSSEVPSTREGGGLISLPRADNPLVFAAPTDLDFGPVRLSSKTVRSIQLTDAGGGAGTWTVAAHAQSTEPGVSVTVPAQVTVPGPLAVTVQIGPSAAERDLTGFVVLTHGTDTRRIPYWFRVEQPKLGSEPFQTLLRPGTYSGDTRGKPSRVDRYRYPDLGAPGVSHGLAGPEQVFRYRVKGPVANIGAVVTQQGAGANITPRVVVAGNENSLTGYAGLPLNINPYLGEPDRSVPAAGAILPGSGAYDIVFDSPSKGTAGPFTFRFWVNDTTPPSIRLQTPRPVGGRLILGVSDAGSGVDPSSFVAQIDGKSRPVRSLPDGRAAVSVGSLSPGRHVLTFQASDFQEAKNMENVGPILPNTRRLRASFVVP